MRFLRACAIPRNVAQCSGGLDFVVTRSAPRRFAFPASGTQKTLRYIAQHCAAGRSCREHPGRTRRKPLRRFNIGIPDSLTTKTGGDGRKNKGHCAARRQCADGGAAAFISENFADRCNSSHRNRGGGKSDFANVPGRSVLVHAVHSSEVGDQV